jgi:hypothetical protein
MKHILDCEIYESNFNGCGYVKSVIDLREVSSMKDNAFTRGEESVIVTMRGSDKTLLIKGRFKDLNKQWKDSFL